MAVKNLEGKNAPCFTLPSMAGGQWSFQGRPAGGALLLIFFETDCPTCALVVPYVNRMHLALASSEDLVVGVSQDDLASTKHFCKVLNLEFPVLLDGDLEVSRQYDPVAVPAFYLLDADGIIQRAEVGFSKDALNSMASAIFRVCNRDPIMIASPRDGQPDWKPGCGSRHRQWQPSGAAARLTVSSERAAKAALIELDDSMNPIEYCLDHGFDPLPVVPPTVERVGHMLGATHFDAQQIVGRIPPCYGAASVEKIAANAVMAGCSTGMMKILIPLIRAACDERLNLHGFQATPHFAAPLVIVNGPVRNELGFACGQNVLSNVARANSTLGRAFQLILRNLGGADPLSIDMSALGNPGKFSYCIAENEEDSPWEPLHVERGFDAQLSTVTICAAESPRGVSEHQAKTAQGLLRTISHTLATVWNYRVCLGQQALVLVGLEHAATLTRAGYSKQNVREALFESTGVPLRYYDDDDGEGTQYTRYYEEVDIDGQPCYRKFQSPEAIRIVVTGGRAGKFSAVVGGWGRPVLGSEMVTYPIEESSV